MYTYFSPHLTHSLSIEGFDPGPSIDEVKMDQEGITNLDTSGSESEKDDNAQCGTYILTSSNNNYLKLTLIKPKNTINTNNNEKEKNGFN